jgi:ribosomal protein S18 acetylase RimI-like enzyme
MAVIPQTSSGDLTTRLLGPEDGPTAWRFLIRNGIQHVYVASQIWAGALEHRSAEGGPDFYGAFEDGGLCAILYMGNGGLAVPAGRTTEALVPFGPVLAERARKLRALIGPAAAIGVLLPYVESADVKPRVDVHEFFMEVDESGLDVDARLPELRSATLRDLDLVAEASNQAHCEEMGDDPLASNPTAFMGRVARQILDERVFIIRQGEKLIFKAELSAKCPLGAQISGVYTNPEYRSRGFARRGTAELAWRALGDAPTICLFVWHDNAAARRAYDRIGFRHTGDFRTLFLERSRRAGLLGAAQRLRRY